MVAVHIENVTKILHGLIIQNVGQILVGYDLTYMLVKSWSRVDQKHSNPNFMGHLLFQPEHPRNVLVPFLVCFVCRIGIMEKKIFCHIIIICGAGLHFHGSRYSKNGQNRGYLGLLTERSFQNK